MDEKNLLLGRMEDLARKAEKTGFAISRFLTPAEAAEVSASFARRKDILFSLDGGYEGAERTRAVFLNNEWGFWNRDENFSALKIDVKSGSIGHRDILGSLMGMGIERDTIGDIIESELVLICLPEMAEYLLENLHQIGRTTVRISKMDLEEVPPRKEVLKEKTDSVASLRLDALVGAAFGLSRGRASEAVASGRVSLNHVLCVQSAKEVSEGALISVRGLGRARLLEVGGTTKKGRIFIRMGVYGR